MQTETTTAGASARLEQLRTAGRNLWLAGLGAAVEIENEGKGLFDRLVERGRPFEERQKQTVNELGDKAGAKLREMRDLVRDQVRHDVKQVLTRVGVPTLEDFRLLTSRLETLSAKIDALSTHPAVSPEPETTPETPTTQPRATARKKG
jgi:poly(hydroxyalkanoate) granule-associated protein